MSISYLRRRSEFLRVQSSSCRSRTRLGVWLVMPSHASEARVGLVVSRRVGSAVVRNRVKRRMRAVVRSIASAFLPAHDYVFIAYSQAVEVPFVELTAETQASLAICTKKLVQIQKREST